MNFATGSAKPKNTYSESPDLVHFCDLQLVETVPDVLEEKDLSHQLTSKSIYEVSLKRISLNISWNYFLLIRLGWVFLETRARMSK